MEIYNDPYYDLYQEYQSEMMAEVIYTICQMEAENQACNENSIEHLKSQLINTIE